MADDVSHGQRDHHRNFHPRSRRNLLDVEDRKDLMRFAWNCARRSSAQFRECHIRQHNTMKGNTMAKNQNPALDVVREELKANGEGLYYVATEAMFQIAFTLQRFGAEVPAAWEFSPGAWTPSEDDNSEENQDENEGSYMGAEFDLMMREGMYSNLIHAGNVLDRLRDVMNAEGLGL